MSSDTLLFYGLAGIIVYFAFGVLLSSNPIKSAFNLVLTMVGISGIFFSLQAGFLGAVQLAVYAGAVMVLFVMVLMMFDLKQELEDFATGFFSGLLKLFAVGLTLSLVVNAVMVSSDMLQRTASLSEPGKAVDTKSMASLVFTDYVFAFETLGVLLLVVAVGAVAISRIKGGTHASD